MSERIDNENEPTLLGLSNEADELLGDLGLPMAEESPAASPPTDEQPSPTPTEAPNTPEEDIEVGNTFGGLRLVDPESNILTPTTVTSPKPPAQEIPDLPADATILGFDFNPSEDQPKRKRTKDIRQEANKIGNEAAGEIANLADKTLKIETNDGTEKVNIYTPSSLSFADRLKNIDQKENIDADIDMAAVGAASYVLQKAKPLPEGVARSEIEKRPEFEELKNEFTKTFKWVANKQAAGEKKGQPDFLEYLTSSVGQYQQLQEQYSQAKAERKEMPSMEKAKQKSFELWNKIYPGNVKKISKLTGADEAAETGSDFVDLLKQSRTAGSQEEWDEQVKNYVSSRIDSQPDLIDKYTRPETNPDNKLSTANVELRNRLKNQMEAAQKYTRKMSDEELDTLATKVDEYKALHELNEQDTRTKRLIGVGRTALGGVVDGARKLSDLGNRYLNPWYQPEFVRLDQLKEKNSKIIKLTVLGAVAIGTVWATYKGFGNPFESGTGTENMATDASGVEPSVEPTDSETTPADDETEDELADDPAEGSEEKDPAEEEVAENQPTRLDPNERTTTETLREFTGELNPETGLLEGTPSASAAQTALDMGVDFDQHQSNPEFQNDLYYMTKESLISQGYDPSGQGLPNDFQLELRNDLLQDFLDKWGPEEVPDSTSTTSENGPHPSVTSSDESTEAIAQRGPSNLESIQPAQNTALETTINVLSKLIPGFSPELAASFKDTLMSNSNMVANLYSGVPVSPQEALTYANLHNSLIVPPLEHGYEQFVDNMQRMISEFLNRSGEDEDLTLAA